MLVGPEGRGCGLLGVRLLAGWLYPMLGVLRDLLTLDHTEQETD